MVELQTPNIKEYTPLSWGVMTRYGCPSKCNICLNISNPENTTEIPDNLLDAYIDAALKRIPSNGNFTISGGEPMLNPEQVYYIIERLQEGTFKTKLSSNFLGSTEKDISQNTSKLIEVGLDTFAGSLDVPHRNSHPTMIKIPYIDYHFKIYDSFIKSGIEKIFITQVYTKKTVEQTKQIGIEMLDRLGVKIQYEEDIGFNRTILGKKDKTEIILFGGPVISSGRAGYNCIQYFDDDKYLTYECPAINKESHDDDVLLLGPEGNVKICCNAEKDADFGFGNANEYDIGDIIENIQKSKLFDNNFPKRLQIAHKFMDSFFPGYLPDYGAKLSCEICNAMASNPTIKNYLKTLELFDGCF